MYFVTHVEEIAGYNLVVHVHHQDRVHSVQFFGKCACVSPPRRQHNNLLDELSLFAREIGAGEQCDDLRPSGNHVEPYPNPVMVGYRGYGPVAF